MITNASYLMDLVLGVAVFGLVMSLWTGIMLVWGGRRAARLKRIERRLGLIDAHDSSERVLHLWHDGKEATTTVPTIGVPTSVLRRFDEG